MYKMQEINSVLFKLHMCVLVLLGLNVEAKSNNSTYICLSMSPSRGKIEFTRQM